MPLKPIVHGSPDPFEVPYYCRKCEYFEHSEKGSPICAKTGKFFRPALCFTCYVPKGTNVEIFNTYPFKKEEDCK